MCCPRTATAKVVEAITGLPPTSTVLAPLLPGMEHPPHAMLRGDDETDYYRGQYAAPAPGTSGEATQ